LRAMFRIFWDALQRFAEDDGWAIASHIALSVLMSMFPFLIFVTALAGFFGSNDRADAAAQLLLQTWPDQVAGPLGGEIHDVLTQSHSGLLTLGAVLSLYFSSSGVEALRTGLNRAYDEKDSRSWWWLRLESIAYVVVAALAFIALAFLLVLGPLIWSGVLAYFPAFATLDQLVTLGRFAIATAILLLALTIIHMFLPARRRSLADVAPGILLTLGLWVGAGMAFGSYLAQFARNYVNTYAGLASVMIALVFLYMLAAIFIFGGELNAAILRWRRNRRRTKDAPSANPVLPEKTSA
jgi:membrane protein